ncbi:hypothetical protein TL16_g07716, partial [Triparma laevis f. inornata]
MIPICLSLVMAFALLLPSGKSFTGPFGAAGAGRFGSSSRASSYPSSRATSRLFSRQSKLFIDSVVKADINLSPDVEFMEQLIELEKSNPTDAPAQSTLINSVWNVKAIGGYSAPKLTSPTREIALFLYSGSYSPGVFLLKLLNSFSSILGSPSVQIAISRPGTEPRVTATAKSNGGSFDSEITLNADLQTAGPIRLKETYQSLKSPLGEFEIPKALQYSRPLYVTYLDDDLLVLRDESGVPEVLSRAGVESSSEKDPGSVDVSDVVEPEEVDKWDFNIDDGEGNSDDGDVLRDDETLPGAD